VNAKKIAITIGKVEKNRNQASGNQVAGGEDRQNGSEERGEEVSHG